MDIAIACAGVVLATASVLLATAAQLRLRAPRPVRYAIAVPPGPTPVPELFLTHLCSLLRSAGWLSPAPEISVVAIGSSDGVQLVVSMPQRYRSSLEASLDAMWPGAKLVRTDAARRPTAARRWRPAATATQRPSALAGAAPALLRALTRAATREQLSFEIALRRRRARASLASNLVRDQRPRTAHRSRVEPRRDVAAPIFDASVAIAAWAPIPARARTLVRDFAPSLAALCSGTGMHLEPPTRFGKGDVRSEGALSITQLAFLLPLAQIADAAVQSSSLTTEGERLIGRRTVGRGDAEVRFSLKASRHHLHVLGPTGTGKSTLLLNLITQDIAAGRGCAVFDPKGDLVRDLLQRIPRRRVDDVVYVGPDEGTRAVGINPLQLGAHEDPTLAAENVLAIFKRVYADSWGPRTDDVLKSCLLTLAAVRGATLAHIPALLSDGAARRELTAHVDDVGVGGFWRWYERVSEGKRLEVAAPLQHKLRDVLVRPRLRRLLCQTHSSLELGTLMDRRGILLCDLGAGRWGEGASALAGSFLVARLWQAALSRQARPEDERTDFLLYIDEFQTFLGIGGPFADALAQARALRLSLTLANQHLGQLPREIGAAVAANARSRVVFRPSALDASALAGEFPSLDEHALLALAPFEAAIRLSDSGSAFTARLLPAAAIPFDAASPEEVLERSRARYGRPVAVVDEELRRVVGPVEVGDEPVDMPSPS